jgi:hypothetical protein
MHFSEICSSILENRPKNYLEYMAIVKIVVSFMKEDPEFRHVFDRELLKNILNLIESGINPLEKYSNSYSSFKCFFRLALELQAIKASKGKFTCLSMSLHKLLSQEEDKSQELIPFSIYLLKSLKAYLPPSLDNDDKLFQNIYEVIVSFFKSMSRYSLRLFKNFKTKEIAARKIYEQKGDLFPDAELDLISAYEKFKTLKSSLEGFGDVIRLPVPIFENSEPQFIADDGKVIFKSEISIETELYQDADERAFYEDFPSFAGDQSIFVLPDEWKTADGDSEICADEVDPEAIGSIAKDRYAKFIRYNL